MRIAGRTVRADWGHLAFASVIAGVTAAYLYDVLQTSLHPNNILLVVPLSILVLALYLVLVVRAVTIERPGTAEPAAPAREAADSPDGTAPQTRGDLLRGLVLLLGLGAYVALFQTIGLDVATFLFTAGGLVLLGVRRPVFVAIYAAIFTVVVVGGARLLLYYPMHTVFL